MFLVESSGISSSSRSSGMGEVYLYLTLIEGVPGQGLYPKIGNKINIKEQVMLLSFYFFWLPPFFLMHSQLEFFPFFDIHATLMLKNLSASSNK